jgi:RND family efflux transporter MFP subunit
MKRIAIVVLILAALGAAFAGSIYFAKRTPSSAVSVKKERKVLYWVDPMHPAYKSDKPGIAPDCGMKLEPVYEDTSEPMPGMSHANEEHGKLLYYSDPKEPAYRSAKPGLNPATGNDLEPVYEKKLEAPSFQVSAEKQQLLGVKFETATMAMGSATIRAVGRIAQDETKITRVHPRIEGWIYKTHIDFTGQLVKKGDPMLTLYSPEMLATQNEYLLALRARDTMKAGPSHEAYENSEFMILASRRRLELWDLSDAQIDQVEQTGKAIQTITLYSPVSGYVTSRNAYPSQRVGPDTELYAIADLSHVWIMADVFESDLPNVRLGQTATVSVPNEGGRTFPAHVTYIQPQVDPVTRTIKVRLESTNHDLKLKPEMFVNVDFHVAGANRISLPADAVMNTGLRQTVFVDQGNGNLEPRAVETGERVGDRIQILSGLRPGERVVASGTFLIDSEAQLKNAIPQDNSSAPRNPHAGHGGHAHD